MSGKDRRAVTWALPAHARLYVGEKHPLISLRNEAIGHQPGNFKCAEATLYFETPKKRADTDPSLNEFFERFREHHQRWLGTVYVCHGEAGHNGEATRNGETDREEKDRIAYLCLSMQPGHEFQDDPKTWLRRGRGILCKCFGGQYLSLTFRADWVTGQPGDKSQPDDKSQAENTWIRLSSLNEKAEIKSSIPRTGYGIEPNLSKPLHEVLVRDVLFKEIFPEQRPDQHGLVIITGATKSNKSVLARGLVERWLEDARRKDGKRSHVVTIEDPIEARLANLPYTHVINRDQEGNEINPKTSSQPLISEIEYTPRTIPHDTPAVREALKDALRQTPAVVYIGEIREDEDWQEVMDFAGTGHLVVATAHAGSLVETLGRIFAATKAETPSRRGEIAQRILAAVHLRAFPYQYPNANGLGANHFSVILPALWRNRPAAVNAIVADGLASLLPRRSGESGAGTLGRYCFAQALIERCRKDSRYSGFACPELLRQALDADLKD